MKTIQRLLISLLLFSLMLAGTGCSLVAVESISSTVEVLSSEPAAGSEESGSSETPTPSVDKNLPVNVMVLNGTTGFGMAGLMQEKADGKADLSYTFSVESDPTVITAALLNGSCDIAALPTNAAANLYQKSNGKIQMLALNTKGVLYVLANGEKTSVTDFESLRGKTVYCPAQNPYFIFAALCEKNGLKVGTDIMIDTTYSAAADLRTALVAGQVDLAVLPEPMVTIAMKGNAALQNALDVTAEWEKSFPKDSLVQGCVVVRTEFAAAHPAEVKAFLAEYEESIALLSSDVQKAAETVIAQGIFAGAAPIAAAAIPNCNVCFIVGKEMKAAMNAFCEAMMTVKPESIGGNLPQDNFYYIAK